MLLVFVSSVFILHNFSVMRSQIDKPFKSNLTLGQTIEKLSPALPFLPAQLVAMCALVKRRIAGRKLLKVTTGVLCQIVAAFYVLAMLLTVLATNVQKRLEYTAIVEPNYSALSQKFAHCYIFSTVFLVYCAFVRKKKAERCND